MDLKAVTLIASIVTVATYLTISNVDFTQTITTEGWSQDHDKKQERYLPYFADAESKVDINEFLIGVIENFREDMSVGIPELKVPILDPFQPKKPIKVDVEDSKASVHGNFTNVHVEGKCPSNPEDEQEKQGESRDRQIKTLPLHKSHTTQVIASKARQGRLMSPGTPELYR
ncbi:uncharacterized protein TNCV_4525261 [Trichonephila clavipes]|nr:uncharacterized protein TNCV_4525261 [Trichonephila clavipes]